MNTLFPIFVNLKDKQCVVIGGGRVALRKIMGLLECEAKVRVISPVSAPQILQLHHEHKIELATRVYQPHDTTGAFLVVAATNDRDVNRQISQECTQRNILCNIVDEPDLCNFYYASTYTCGDLKIAISTNGASPALARKIKAELAGQYPQEFIPYLEYLRKIRDVIKENIPEESSRKIILQKIVADPHVREQCQDEHFCNHMAHLNYEQEVKKWL